ncbi:MAG TPA: hypothetical protein VFW94_24150 [Candidatus Acidoferrales bacterium]|nr:hypothetical protein [Candidatus Acidoferrales bacterium]
MKLTKAMVAIGLSRSVADAQRLVKQGAVWVGGCAPPCNPRQEPFLKCFCGGWRKITNPAERVETGEKVRVSSGNWRLVNRTDGRPGWDQLPGIGEVPDEGCASEADTVGCAGP